MDTKDKSGYFAKPNESVAGPEYIELVRDAILALDERNGSSAKAITDHILANHWAPGAGGTEERVRAALSEGLESGTLDQVGRSHYKVIMLV